MKSLRSFKSAIQSLLISNWHKYKRDYPWRHRISAYRIMIAEFMLQRTRADQVAPVYQKFTTQFPSIKSLAKARTREVARYTRHLGIHWRAKHFIESSRFVVRELGGKIPSRRDKLLSVPGIGEYVAGAILTVAFQKSEWVIDSNIARFFDRFFNLRLKGELRRKPQVVQAAKEFFNFQNPRKLLFSLLDFTALICTPRQPRCPICPLKQKCQYKMKTKI